MPIKPENKKLYPKNWPEIRLEIQERAGNKCELCGVENHAIGFRDKTGAFKHWLDINNWPYIRSWSPKQIKIVCTVMHLDHNPQNNGIPGDRPNLKFGCQKCHNEYDRPHRMANAAKTRLAAKSEQKP